MTTAHGRFRATRRFGSLDGLRALAVLAVVWHHSPSRTGFAGWPASWRGYLGVDVFFVVSGFLITTLLLREREQRGRVRVGGFLARRALRLFPLWYAVLVGHWLVLTWLLPDAPITRPFLRDLPYYATYTSNWIHAGTYLILSWSLAAEEQFYVTWAPAVALLGRRAAWVAAVVLGLSALTAFGAFDAVLAGLLGDDFARLDMVQATFAPVALGCLGGLALHGERGFARVHATLGGRYAAPLAALAFLACASLPFDEPPRAGRLLIQVAAAALVLACVVREDHGLARLLRWRPLARVGVVSYGIYLLHIVTLQAVRAWAPSVGLPRGAMFWTNAVASWLAAEVSYRALEAPFLRLRERFRGPP